MRDPAHKIMGATAAPDKKENSFCSVFHWEIYAALVHHNSPKKLELRQPKMEMVTGNSTSCDQRYYTVAERRGSCKMALFSDVKLKVPRFCCPVVVQERTNRLVTMHTSIARRDVWCKN